MSYLVISCSLNQSSYSKILAQEATLRLKQAAEEVEFIDLQQIPLPLCDGDRAYSDPNVTLIKNSIVHAQGIVLGVPIYNYDVNAACKNLIELTGKAWEGKAVGFACAAGSRSSYMSIMGLANSLILDYRCHILPRFLYTVESSFTDDKLEDTEIHQRLDILITELRRLTHGLFEKV